MGLAKQYYKSWGATISRNILLIATLDKESEDATNDSLGNRLIGLMAVKAVWKWFVVQLCELLKLMWCFLRGWQSLATDNVCSMHRLKDTCDTNMYGPGHVKD